MSRAFTERHYSATVAKSRCWGYAHGILTEKGKHCLSTPRGSTIPPIRPMLHCPLLLVFNKRAYLPRRTGRKEFRVIQGNFDVGPSLRSHWDFRIFLSSKFTRIPNAPKRYKFQWVTSINTAWPYLKPTYTHPKYSKARSIVYPWLPVAECIPFSFSRPL